MKLTDPKIKAIKTPGKHADGLGLYLEVTASGGKYWRLKYRHAGKEKRLALGVYPTVTLAEARKECAKAREVIARGDDPGELRKEEKAKTAHEQANTLRAVAEEWMAHQAERWDPVTMERIKASLENDVMKPLGYRPLASIKPREVMAVVKKIEARGASDQAGRVLQRIKAVFRWAVVHERIESNPMLDLVPREILKPRQVKHRAALSDKDLPEFLGKLAAYDGDVHTVNAMRLLMLTACRPGEVRGARWAEFDLDAALWTIPADRMKMGVEHRVPLSRQALEVLQTMKPLSGSRDLVFPSPFYPSKPLSENTFNSALARMGYKNEATAHGFRALFSTVANETGWNADAIERALAHTERNAVRGAYNRGQYIEERAKLLQWWADYLDAKRIGNVIPIGRTA